MIKNSVIVLVTKGPEYRVAYLPNAGDIVMGLNVNTNKWIPNKSWIARWFELTIVDQDRESALRHAKALSKQVEPIELPEGIQVIDIWSDIEYNDLINN